MISLIKNMLIFTAIISLIISVLLFYFYKIGGDDLVAPADSNSISFNEKIDFIKDKDLSKIEYIAMGSSMTLNNINSQIMTESIGENYINLGSWGFKISDSEIFLRNTIDFFPNLKTVIISTTFVDFSSAVRNISVDYGLVKSVLGLGLGNIAYILSLDLKYLNTNSKTNKEKMLNSESYYFLKYDSYGGVILEIDKENINSERWNKEITEFDVSAEELGKLSDLLLLLNNRNINTVIAVPPQRKGLMNEDKFEKISSDIEKIKKTSETGKAVFVNSFEEGYWEDSLFVDYCHLNRKGTEIYTKLIISRIKQP
jgi:sporulation protein YlmC with PRC-barrel domain